jgi:hypothetical protein
MRSTVANSWKRRTGSTALRTDGAGKTNTRRASGRGCEDHRRRRIEEFLTMMLADAEHIESDTIGGFHFREKFLHPIGGWQSFAGRRIWDGRSETVDSDFYHHRFHIPHRPRSRW